MHPWLADHLCIGYGTNIYILILFSFVILVFNFVSSHPIESYIDVSTSFCHLFSIHSLLISISLTRSFRSNRMETRGNIRMNRLKFFPFITTYLLLLLFFVVVVVVVVLSFYTWALKFAFETSILISQTTSALIYTHKLRLWFEWKTDDKFLLYCNIAYENRYISSEKFFFSHVLCICIWVRLLFFLFFLYWWCCCSK